MTTITSTPSAVVDTISTGGGGFILAPNHFDSSIFHGGAAATEAAASTASFHCNESLTASPSTSSAVMGSQISTHRSRQSLPTSVVVGGGGPAAVAPRRSILQPRGVLQTSNHANIIPYSSSMIFREHRKRDYDYSQVLRRELSKLNNPQKPFVTSQTDWALHGDATSLKRLLSMESAFVYSVDDILTKQPKLDLGFRKIVVEWLRDVCRELDCEAVALPLAVNIMDRFLCKQSIPVSHLQAVAAASLFIACKMVAPVVPSASVLVDFTDGYVKFDEFLKFEDVISGVLEFNFSAPTPFEFLDQLLVRSRGAISPARQPFQRLCYSILGDAHLASLRPSQQAVICVAYAGLELENQKVFGTARNFAQQHIGMSFGEFNGLLERFCVHFDTDFFKTVSTDLESLPSTSKVHQRVQDSDTEVQEVSASFESDEEDDEEEEEHVEEEDGEEEEEDDESPRKVQKLDDNKRLISCSGSYSPTGSTDGFERSTRRKSIKNRQILQQQQFTPSSLIRAVSLKSMTPTNSRRKFSTPINRCQSFGSGSQRGSTTIISSTSASASGDDSGIFLDISTPNCSDGSVSHSFDWSAKAKAKPQLIPETPKHSHRRSHRKPVTKTSVLKNLYSNRR